MSLRSALRSLHTHPPNRVQALQFELVPPSSPPLPTDPADYIALFRALLSCFCTTTIAKMNFAIFGPFTSSSCSSFPTATSSSSRKRSHVSFAEYKARPTKRARRSIRSRRRLCRVHLAIVSTAVHPPHLPAQSASTSVLSSFRRSSGTMMAQDEDVYLTAGDDLHVVLPFVEDVHTEEDYPMSHDAYSPPAAPTIPQASAPTAVNSVTPAAIASVASASPEPIYIEDDIRGLASWNLDCVTIGRPELSEHAPSAAEHCTDAATADLVPAAESDSQSTAVSQDRVVGDPSTVGPVAAAALATVSSSDWTAVVVTSQDRVVDEVSTIDPIASPALPSSNSTGVMAPQDRAGHDEDSDKPAPDKGKARQVIPDLFETPLPDSPALVQGPNPFLLIVPVLWWALCNEESSDSPASTSGWVGVEECVRPSSMGPGTRVTPARSTPTKTLQGANRVAVWAQEDEEGEEARQGERAAFRWKSSGDDRPQPQEAVTARQLRAAPGPSFSTSPGGQSAHSSPLPTCSIRYNFARARVHHQTLFCIVSTLDLSIQCSIYFFHYFLIISGPIAPLLLDP
ncbi:hypothetical protein B0H13DRAFT_2356372 [Mycena leptocephala]|nr:hypothetical protein B0H13DRAFT_2356372 [Mycena leptocephala]